MFKSFSLLMVWDWSGYRKTPSPGLTATLSHAWERGLQRAGLIERLRIGLLFPRPLAAGGPSGPGEGRLLANALVIHGATGIPHISFAYAAMVRSEENAPILATLMMDFLAHSAGCRYSSSTFIWVDT